MFISFEAEPNPTLRPVVVHSTTISAAPLLSGPPILVSSAVIVRSWLVVFKDLPSPTVKVPVPAQMRVGWSLVTVSCAMLTPAVACTTIPLSKLDAASAKLTDVPG